MRDGSGHAAPEEAIPSRNAELGHSGRVETATQALHRLTSYAPGREWTEPVDDSRVVQDLEVNDPARFPWHYKRYPSGLPRTALPRDLPTTEPATLDVLAGTAQVPERALDLPHLSRLLYLSAGVVRTAELSHRRYLFRAAGRRAPGSRWRCTSRRRRAARSLRVCTGTTPLSTRSSRSGPRRAAGHPPWSSPASRGVLAGGTASGATGTCTGTRARCSRSCWRSPAPRA